MRDLINALLFTAEVHSDEEEGEDSSISLLCIRAVGEIRGLRDEINGLTGSLDRAEKALKEAQEQEPIKYLYRVTDCFGHDVLRDDPKGAAILETIPLYARPVPAAPAKFTDDDLAEIHQLAYELGGTESGEYILDGEQLDSVIVKAASLFYKPVPAAVAVHAVPDACYLLERQENGMSWYIGATTRYGGAWHWTADVNAAMRFSRKEDALACWSILAKYHVGVGGIGTTETVPTQHIFEDTRALLQSGEGKK